MRQTMLVVLLLLGAVTAGAQQRNVHKGFWIGFGLGGGVNLSSGLDGSSQGGGGAYLRMGGTVSQKVLLGGETIGWGRDENNTSHVRGNVMFIAQYYPMPTSGFYLKSGIGGAFISTETSSGNTTVSTDKGGFGMGAGLGYELQVGRNIYLVGAADYLLQLFDEENVPGLGQIPSSNSIMLFTLGLTWH